MSTPPHRPPGTTQKADDLGAADTASPSDTIASTVIRGGSGVQAEDQAPMETDYPRLSGVDPRHYRRGLELARGGMGRIVEAHDRRLGRAVALKELLVDSEGFRARFEREARITARLQHPSIVDIHEAGVWPGGEPFFAMKLVAGRPLDRVIHEARTLPERLALLPSIIAATSAMAYAHQRRVIHRDLKPGNVLVGEFGETVVIDWGLAKDLTGSTWDDEPAPGLPPASASQAATVAGSVMGTPGYMPPEQARGEPVDERADVYALGAMLYHLLAGAPPYSAPTATEVLEQVRAGPPPPLRARVPGVPKDLLTIVETAMARERTARYRTAKELADDLTRFQTGQLVASHHYTRKQLLRRWLKRNSRTVAVSATALLVLLVSGGLSLQRIVRERARAEASRAEAESLVEFMVVDLRKKLAPLMRVELLSAVARQADTYYQHRGEALGPDEQWGRALAYSNIGDVLASEGDTRAALAEYRKGLTLSQSLVASEPSSFRFQHKLSGALAEVAEMLAVQGDAEEALSHHRQALAIRERLAVTRPDQPEVRRNVWSSHVKIGDILLARGDRPGALASYRTALAISEALALEAPGADDRQADLAMVYECIGAAVEKGDDGTEALAQFSKALAIRERLAGKDLGNTQWQLALARLHGRLGGVFRHRGELTKAATELRAALAIDQRLADREPSQAELQRTLSVDTSELGNVLSEQGDLTGALREYQADLAIAERLAARDPSNTDGQRDLAISHMNVGDVWMEQGELSKALEEYRASIAVRARSTEKEPANLDAKAELAAGHARVGDVLLALQNADGALAEYQQSLALVEALSTSAPKNPSWADDAAVAHTGISEALLAQGHADAALAAARRALAVRERLELEEPGSAEFQEGLGDARAQLAAALVATKALEEARAAYRASADVFERLSAKEPSNAHARERASTLRALSTTCCGPSPKRGR